MKEDTEAFLHQWAAARAGDNAKVAEALRGLVDAYCALSNLDEAAVLREFLTLLSLPEGGTARQEFLWMRSSGQRRVCPASKSTNGSNWTCFGKVESSL